MKADGFRLSQSIGYSTYVLGSIMHENSWCSLSTIPRNFYVLVVCSKVATTKTRKTSRIKKIN